MRLAIVFYGLSFFHLTYSDEEAELKKLNNIAYSNYKNQLPMNGGYEERRLYIDQFECEKSTLDDALKYIEEEEKSMKSVPKGKNVIVVIGENGNPSKYALANVLAETSNVPTAKIGELPEVKMDRHPRLIGEREKDGSFVLDAPDLRGGSVAIQMAGIYLLNEAVKDVNGTKLVFAYYISPLRVWDYFTRIADNNPSVGIYNLSKAEAFISTEHEWAKMKPVEELLDNFIGFGNHPGLLRTRNQFSKDEEGGREHIESVIGSVALAPPLKFVTYGHYSSCVQEMICNKIIQDLSSNTEKMVQYFKNVRSNETMSTSEKLNIFQMASANITDILNEITEDMEADAVTNALAKYAKNFELDGEIKNIQAIPKYAKLLSTIRKDFKVWAWKKGLETLEETITTNFQELEFFQLSENDVFSCENQQHEEIMNQELYELKFELAANPNDTGDGWIEFMRELEEITGGNIVQTYERMEKDAKETFFKSLQTQLENFDGNACKKEQKETDRIMEEPEDCDEDAVEETVDYLLAGADDVITEARETIVVVLGSENSGQLQTANLLATFEVGSPTNLDLHVYPEFFLDPPNEVYSLYAAPSYSEEKTESQEVAGSFFFHRVLSNTLVKILVTFNIDSIKDGGNDEFKLILKEASEIFTATNFTKCVSFVISGVEVGEEEKLEEIVKTVAEILLGTFETISKASDTDEKVKGVASAFVKEKEETMKKIGILRKSEKLSDESMFKENKEHLQKIINENLDFREYNQQDILALLSEEEAKLSHCVEWRIRNEMIENITKVLNPLEKFYKMLEDSRNADHTERYREFNHANKLILSLLGNIVQSEEPIGIFDPLIDLMVGLKLPVSQETIRQIENDAFFIQSNGHVIGDAFSEGFDSIQNYMTSSRRWYFFLTKLDEWLSKYDIAKGSEKYEEDAKKLLRAIRNDAAENSDITEFLDSVKAIPQTAFKNLLGKMTPKLAKYEYLASIIDRIFAIQLEVDCSDDINVFRGAHVTLSECLRKRCHPKKSIEIHVSNVFYLDKDMNETGNGIYLAIMAPEWQIIGERIIILDGENAENIGAKKAEDGEKPTVAGKDGDPGLPGGPAGKFLGVGAMFSKKGSLRISAVGGKGSPGQDGGDGGPSLDPEKPPIKRDLEYTVNFPKLGFQNVRGYCSSQMYCFFTFYKNAGDGAPGGNGGKSGDGGLSGEVTMVYLNEVPYLRKTEKTSKDLLLITSKAEKGEDGSPGRGGRPGFRRKGDWHLTQERVKWFFGGITYNYGLNKETFSNNGRHGKPGEDNINDKKKKKVEDLKIQPEFAVILNKYKGYLRNSFSRSTKNFLPNQFIHDIARNEQLNKLYDTAGFADEYHRLEQQSFKLKTKTSVVPFYEMLYQQIANYSDTTKINDEEKKVLAYMCTAILSKLAGERNKNTPLVVDLSTYLKDIVVEMKQLKDFENDQLVQSYKNDYKKKVEEMTAEANQMIENDIKPNLEMVKDKMSKGIDKLVKEVVEKKKATKAQRKTLEDKKKELKKTMLMRKVLGVVGVATSMLSFLGPTAGAIGGAINAGVRITQSLAMSGSANDVSKALVSIPASVNSQLTTFSTVLTQKKSAFGDQLEDIDKRLDNMQKNDVDANIQSIKDKVKTTKTELSKIDVKSLDANTLKKINNLRDGLSKEMDAKKSNLQAIREKDAKIDKRIVQVGRLQSAVNVGEQLAQTYNSLKSSDDAIDEVNRQLEENAQAMKKLESYEINVYAKMMPMVSDIKDRVDGLGEGSKGKSHAALDVEQWKVSEYLADMKEMFRKMTDGFDMSEEMQTTLSKVDRGTVVMMQCFHRIQDNKDKSELATFLADINSNKASEIKIKNPLLNRLINDVQISIKINLILEAYNRAFKSFLHSFFPLGTELITTLRIPPKLGMLNSTKEIIFYTEEKINFMVNKISASRTQITKYDKDFINDAKFNIGEEDDMFPPYYIWKYKDHSNAIKKLLEGKTIEVNADIHKLVGENFDKIAIKIKTLQLALVPREEKNAKKINDIMKKVRIELTSLGSFSYKCADKYFEITNEPFTIVYTHLRSDEDKTEPYEVNDVYAKIKHNTAMFSPYGKWNVTLTNRDIKKLLKPMKNMEMDLQFYGKGFYIRGNSDVCEKNLELLYRRDGSVPRRAPTQDDFMLTIPQ